jgi:hypothetical protein
MCRGAEEEKWYLISNFCFKLELLILARAQTIQFFYIFLGPSREMQGQYFKLPLPSTFFLIHYSPTIPPFDII